MLSNSSDAAIVGARAEPLVSPARLSRRRGRASRNDGGSIELAGAEYRRARRRGPDHGWPTACVSERTRSPTGIPGLATAGRAFGSYQARVQQPLAARLAREGAAPPVLRRLGLTMSRVRWSNRPDAPPDSAGDPSRGSRSGTGQRSQTRRRSIGRRMTTRGHASSPRAFSACRTHRVRACC
jgi:hypothetical protein